MKFRFIIVFALLALFFIPWESMYGDLTGFINPTSAGPNYSCTGGPASRIFTDDSQTANCKSGNIADADMFNFSITDGNKIDGIEVRVNWSVDSGSIMRLDCRLLDAANSVVGNTKSAETSSSAEVTQIMGAGNDMWGTSFGESDVESANFGVACDVVKVSGSGNPAAYIDNINIRITHSVPAFDGRISSAFSQILTAGDAATSTSIITITPDSTAPSHYNTTDDIRIAIASSSVNVAWDTSVTSMTASGQAVSDGHIALSPAVTYEGGNGGNTVAVIPVASNFDARTDSFTVSGLKYIASSTASNAAAAALQLFKDGVSDFTADAVDDKTVTVKGGLHIDNHTFGQQTNQFAGKSVTDTVLFRFRLEPIGEHITVSRTTFVIQLFGIQTSHLANFEIFPDFDGSGNVNGKETNYAVGGSPVISSTTLVFPSSFATSTPQNYLLEGDVTAIKVGNEITIQLLKEGVNASGGTSSAVMTATGTIARADHIFDEGIGGGGGSGDRPGGGEDSSGGSGGGGRETLGEETGFFAPTTVGIPAHFWTNGTDGIHSDDLYATEATVGEGLNFNNFSFGIPSTNDITGIEVKIEASGSANQGSIDVALTWDNDGTNATTTSKNTGIFTTKDTIYVFGGEGDVWGRTDWTADEMSDANFSVELTAQPSGNTIRVDAIRVKVYHQTTGGGGGGGGRT